MNRRRCLCLAAVALLAWIAFLLRAGSLDAQSLWRDEVDALRFATAPWSEMLSNFTRPGWNGPLYYLLLRGWIALTGTTEYAMRFFSLLFGVLCVPLIYRVGRRLFTPWVGVISALLATTSPYLVWYSQEVKMYTLVPALALLAIYSLHRALDGGGWPWWVAQIVATSLAFYSHILAALLIPVQFLFALAWWPQTRKRWRGALISLACLTLPYLPLAAWQAPLVLQTRDTGFYPYSLEEMVAVLLNGWTTGVKGWSRPWGPALTSLLAAVELATESIYVLPPFLRMVGWRLIGLISGSSLLAPVLGLSRAIASKRADDWQERWNERTRANGHLVLLIWLVVPLLSVWLISLQQPLFTDRYLIWSAPAFYLLVALALTSFATTEHGAPWIVVPLLGALLVVHAVNLRGQATKPIKSDFRAAAAYVTSYREASPVEQPAPIEADPRYTLYLPIITSGPSRFKDLFIFQIPYGRYTFDYYFPTEDYPRAEGLYTNHQTASGAYRMSEEQAARKMREMTEAYHTVWLIATEVAMWDERNLVQQWLDQHARHVTKADFERVAVYRYELPSP